MTATALAAGAAAGLAALGIVDALALVLARRAASGGAREAAGGRGRRIVALLAGIGSGIGPGAPRSLGARIAAAGLAVPVSDVMAVKAGSALLALAGAAVVAPGAPGRLAPVLLATAPAAAFLAPDAWLARRARRRALTIAAELADVLDLLRVAIAAGLTPKRALAEVGRRHSGLLAAELRRAADQAALGIPSGRVIADLERRCPAAGIAALCAALGRADRHGAPLAPTLTALAAQARARAAQRTLEGAARAAPQIQLVVALLLVPAVLLLVAAALLPAVTGRAV
jgi:tight adherence protein C